MVTPRTPDHIPIHPPRGGRDLWQPLLHRMLYISIHPPRGGRDRLPFGRLWRRIHFNPPAPCGAGPAYIKTEADAVIFQSTRPVGGGTSSASVGGKSTVFQSTRPVGGGTEYRRKYRWIPVISIHPPRGGRDFPMRQMSSSRMYFNPPAPWGAGR